MVLKILTIIVTIATIVLLIYLLRVADTNPDSKRINTLKWLAIVGIIATGVFNALIINFS